MAIEVMNWVWTHSRAKHGARLVLLALADSMGSAHGWAWPSNKSLAEKAGMTDRAVQMAVAELVKLGELEVGYNEGPKGCNRYRVLMDPEKNAPPKSLHPAEDAPPQDFRGDEFSQEDGQDGAKFSGDADFAGVKNSAPDGEKFSPGTVRNRKRSSSTKKISPPREDVERICAYLADRVAANGSKRPNVTETWRKEARLLLDADGRTEDQVRTAIDWCQDNPFWCPKVMSMPKLREKYDQLRLEAKRERDERNGNRQRGSPRGGAAQDLTDQKYGPGSTDI